MSVKMMNALHGRPLLSPSQGEIIHTTTNTDNTVYLFAYSVSNEEDILRVYTQSGGNKTLLTSHLLSAQSHPHLVLNGYIEIFSYSRIWKQRCLYWVDIRGCDYSKCCRRYILQQTKLQDTDNNTFEG